MQGDMDSRSGLNDLSKWYVRANDGNMASFASFSHSDWIP